MGGIAWRIRARRARDPNAIGNTKAGSQYIIDIKYIHNMQPHAPEVLLLDGRVVAQAGFVNVKHDRSVERRRDGVEKHAKSVT